MFCVGVCWCLRSECRGTCFSFCRCSVFLVVCVGVCVLVLV